MNNSRLQQYHIAFVGGGNMAASIIGGLLESGQTASCISAADPMPDSLARLRDIGPIEVYEDNAEAVAHADVIIMAVKPQVMAKATESIADAVKKNSALVISIAAGITVEQIQSRLDPGAAIVRCMPNTPALLRSGASGLFANAQCSEQQRDFAQTILSAVGITCWVDTENELDAITALSGSGPAYFFLFMEAMITAGKEQGLEEEVATRLAVQTALGAARMALESDVDLAELRRRVTSPGGTTERAIQSFERDELQHTVARAMQAAAERAVEMAREMG